MKVGAYLRVRPFLGRHPGLPLPPRTGDGKSAHAAPGFGGGAAAQGDSAHNRTTSTFQPPRRSQRGFMAVRRGPPPPNLPHTQIRRDNLKADGLSGNFPSGKATRGFASCRVVLVRVRLTGMSATLGYRFGPLPVVWTRVKLRRILGSRF